MDKKTMLKNKILSLCTLMFVTASLQGCSGLGNSLGLDKESPDEFSVITRAPLEIPTQLILPPPNLGAPRPQEQSAIKQAETAVFGSASENVNATSSSESALLKKAGATNSNPNIRGLVNDETKKLQDRNKPVAEKLLNISGHNKTPSATVVDAKKELERIQANKKAGRNITDGNTPNIEE